MIVICRLDLNDDQRRALASLIAGKPVKRLATGNEIRQLIDDQVAVLTAASRSPAPRMPVVDPDAPSLTPESDTYVVPDPGTAIPDPGMEFCSDDCCRANDLLRTRVNVLQHRLDTMG